jgi:putative transposase
MAICGTYLKRHHFQSSERLPLLWEALPRLAAKHSWNLQAWAVFSNHYHWVGLSPRDPTTLRTLVSELRTETSNRVERSRPHSGKAGMVSVLGDTPHLPNGRTLRG